MAQGEAQTVNFDQYLYSNMARHSKVRMRRRWPTAKWWPKWLTIRWWRVVWTPPA